ncbi:hypothetical protein N7457_004497 [Penicillium paradoxum]|uniref:uncharacterized protein n=1 Tax=Penicillium paradoxum TaxID=176176 RepID=UPI002548FAF8|nr:uncharacterized protein N7457_004497 [Penicillium paradoxum]KAJ5782723.1 hypothetical protein N7457_004497 [Penicillium paradoxum]
MDSTIQYETSTQRALAIPEILRMIFDQKTGYEGNATSRHSNLLKYALVNSLWFSEAIPVLWARPQAPLDAVMEKISPERRQFYANYVMWTRVLQFSSPPGKEKNSFSEKGPLHGLLFPKLVRTFASIYTTSDSFCVLSQGEVSWARTMYFERREAVNEDERNMDSVFGVISNLMPGLRHMALAYDKHVSHLEGMIECYEDKPASASKDLHWFVREEPPQEKEPKTEVESSLQGNADRHN